MDEILGTVKKVLGVESDFDGFDVDISLAVNTAIMSLTQIGVGPAEGFSVVDGTEVWSDFLGDSKKLEGAKTYICLKSRLLFDPPQNSFLVDAITRQLSELEWRLTTIVEEVTP